MARPKVAIVGSVDEARTFDPPVTDPAEARLACERLGGELAAAGWDLVVYSAKSMFVEADIVHGYVASGKATAKSIHVHAPIGKGSFDEYRERPDLFDPKPDASADWEVTFYRSLTSCDGLIVIGGGRSTLIAGVIALSMRMPVLALAMFGGNARKVWERLANGSELAADEDIAEMGKGWQPDSAKLLVSSLDRQRTLREERQRAEARRAQQSVVVAAVMLLASVAGLVIAWGSRPGTAVSIALLVIVPVLAAAGGALIRTSLDVGRDWTRAGVLGGAAGLITGLLYVAPQLIAAPDMLDVRQAEIVRRLLFFVLPIGFVAGLTFDAVYAKLRGTDVSQSATLDKI